MSATTKDNGHLPNAAANAASLAILSEAINLNIGSARTLIYEQRDTNLNDTLEDALGIVGWKLELAAALLRGAEVSPGMVQGVSAPGNWLLSPASRQLVQAAVSSQNVQEQVNGLQEGAQVMVRLMHELKRFNDEWPVLDDRNHAPLAAIVEQHLHQITAAGPQARAGFVRALLDLLLVFVDGGCGPDPLDGDWDPIANTAPGFEVPAIAGVPS